jgi:hypothetical protein
VVDVCDDGNVAHVAARHLAALAAAVASCWRRRRCWCLCVEWIGSSRGSGQDVSRPHSALGA